MILSLLPAQPRMLYLYLLIPYIHRAPLARPFSYVTGKRLVNRPRYLFPLYVHDCLYYHSAQFFHNCVKSMLASCENLIHQPYDLLPSQCSINSPHCLFPLLCGFLHLWLLSNVLLVPWIMPRGSHSFKFQLKIVYPRSEGGDCIIKLKSLDVRINLTEFSLIRNAGMGRACAERNHR